MNDLPSFLIETSPGHYTLTFSSSGANTFSLCTYKFMWGYIAGIEAVAARAGQNYGSALHLALAAHYRGATRIECEAIMAAHFGENHQPELGSKGRPEWRTASRALAAFDAYLEHYGAEDFEVLGVEEPFEAELGEFPVFDGDRPPIIVTARIRGIRDLRVRWHDQLWVLDHKTSTEWSDLAVDEGKASFQFMEYAWVERLIQQQRIAEISKEHGGFCKGCGNAIDPEVCHCGEEVKRHGSESNHSPVPMGCTCGYSDQSRFPKPDPQLVCPVGGVIGNYLISRQPYSEGRKVTARDLPRDQFVREPYPFSDAQLAEWHEDAMDLAREIFTRWQSQNWKRNRTACAHWGRCEYYRLCWESDPAYREAAALSADYRPRTPSPFEELENGKERV